MATVNLPKPLTAGSPALASDVMDNFTALQSAINGGIEQVNIADGAISSGKLQSNSVTSEKIVDSSITNAKVASNAGIEVSKLASVAASRALVSDAGGKVAASSVTSTELGRLAGVTSPIQGQFTALAASIPSPVFPQGPAAMYHGYILPGAVHGAPERAVLPAGWSFSTSDDIINPFFTLTHNLGLTGSTNQERLEQINFNMYPTPTSIQPEIEGWIFAPNYIRAIVDYLPAFNTGFWFTLIKLP